jgi:hypothetical protein
MLARRTAMGINSLLGEGPELSAEERARLMRSKTDYLDFYGRLKDLPLPISRETGALLYILRY